MINFWEDYFKGLNFDIKLPKLPHSVTYIEESFVYQIDAFSNDQLKTSFKEKTEDAILAAFSILIAIFASQTDLLIGKPPLPLRLNIDFNQSFKQLLEQIEIKTQEIQGKAPPVDIYPKIAFQEKGSDLCLFCEFKNSSLSFRIECRKGLYNQQYLHHFAANLEALLQDAMNHPDSPLFSLEYLSSTEREKILSMGNGKRTIYPSDKAAHRLFEENVLKFSDLPALRYEQKNMSYAELNAKANQLACHLKQMGVKKGDFVGLAIDRSADHILALLGILKADAVAVPLDASYPLERKLFMLEDVQAKLLITHDTYKSVFPIEGLIVYCLDTEKEQLNHYPTDNLQGSAGPLDLININYTSGSTGKPKGVEVIHRGVVRLVVNTDWFSILPQDRMLHLSNVSFDGASFEIWGALLNGACLCIYPHKEFSAAELGDFMQSEKITHALYTARLFNLIVDYELASLQSMRILLSGGDTMSVHHAKMAVDTLPNCSVINAYGPTENGAVTTAFAIKDFNEIDQIVPIGFPIANTNVYILDGNFHLVPIGVTGEIFAGGDGVARGYLHRPGLTKEKFIANPFGEGMLYRTGDLGRFLPGGAIEFLGRIDTQVKIRGNRVELGEIEEALRDHPLVSDSVVIAREDQFGDKKIIAYVEPKAGENISNEMLRAFLESKLLSTMIPAFIIIMPKLPITANGKVDRKALPTLEAILSNEMDLDIPKTPFEELIADIWGTLLELPRIGLKDNFFYLGGHSIIAAQLTIVIEEAFKIKVPMGLIFEESTLEKYAKGLQEIIKKHTDIKDLPITKTELFWIWRNRESRLDPTITIDGSQQAITPAKSILLTGSTGFIGSFLLRELIDNTDAYVYCTIRANSLEEAKSRLKSSLKNYGLWHPEIFKKAIPVLANLENPGLGIKENELKKLENEIDCIFHNGAYVNHSLPYSQLKAANVLGTQEIIRLACKGKIKPLHFVSTAAVFEGKQDRPIPENENLEESKTLFNGYAQSKWVAEKLVMKARSLGLPTNIYRLARVSGHSMTGQGNIGDFLWRMAEASIYLKQAPDIGLQENITPVDYVCKVIRMIASNPLNINTEYHVINPQIFAYKQLYSIFQKLGYRLDFVPYELWRKSLVQASVQSGKERLQAIAPLFSEIDLSHSDKITSYSTEHVQKALLGSGIVCPLVDEHLIRLYIDAFVAKGFFPAYQTTIGAVS